MARKTVVTQAEVRSLMNAEAKLKKALSAAENAKAVYKEKKDAIIQKFLDGAKLEDGPRHAELIEGTARASVSWKKETEDLITFYLEWNEEEIEEYFKEIAEKARLKAEKKEVFELEIA